MMQPQKSLSGFNPTMSGVKRALSKVIHTNGEGRRSSSPGPKSPDHSPSPASHSTLSPTGSHRKSLAAFLFDKEYVSGSENESEDFDSDGMSKNAKKREARKKQHETKSRMSMQSRDSSEDRAKKRLDEAAKTETEEMKARYGSLPLMQSTTRDTDNRINIDTITEDMADQEVVFRARLHHVRAMSAKLVFLIFRQQISTLQGVLTQEPGIISEIFLHWAEHLRTGSIVLVKGIIQKVQVPVKSASIHGVEVRVRELKLIVARAEPGKYKKADNAVAIRNSLLTLLLSPIFRFGGRDHLPRR
jgi:ergosteryl-3beta-O-L-aspartate synthase